MFGALVDLIGEYPGTDLPADLADLSHIVFAEHRTGGVVRVADGDELGFVGDDASQLIQIRSPLRLFTKP